MKFKLLIDHIFSILVKFIPFASLKTKFTNNVILIVKIEGIGSLIKAIPFFIELKENNKDSKICILTNENNKRLLMQIYNGVDEYITFKTNSITIASIIKFIKSLLILIKLKPGILIDIEEHSSIIKVLSLFIPAYKKYCICNYTINIRCTRNFDKKFIHYEKQHIIKIYSDILKELYTNHNHSNFMKIDIIKNKYIKAPVNIRPDERYIVVNPNASKLCLQRRWPLEYFIELLKLITDKFNLNIYIIGSHNEYKYCQKIIDNVNNDKIKNVCGIASFHDTFSLIAFSELFITPDTGPYHLGLLCKVNTISIWGPSDYSKYGNSGIYNNEIKHSLNLECSPCIMNIKTPCKGNNLCIKGIKAEDVFKSITEFIKE